MSKELQMHIFNMFHDGMITYLKRENLDVKFTIYIPYLANLIHSDFNTFHGRFINCKEIFADVFGEERNIIYEIDVLTNAELEIISSKCNEERLEVTCASSELGRGFGALLVVTADDILVFDESEKEISESELEKLCRQYWDSYKS